MLEITASAALLIVGVLSLAATFLSTSRLYEDNRDTRLMATGLRNVVEALKAADFATLTQDYGPGTARPQFWLSDDGSVAFADPGNSYISGTLELFDDETTIPAEFADLTGGFDLNADGSVTAGAIVDYEILPVRIVITVNNDLTGARSRDFHIVLTSTQSW